MRKIALLLLVAAAACSGKPAAGKTKGDEAAEKPDPLALCGAAKECGACFAAALGGACEWSLKRKECMPACKRSADCSTAVLERVRRLEEGDEEEDYVKDGQMCPIACDVAHTACSPCVQASGGAKANPVRCMWDITNERCVDFTPARTPQPGIDSPEFVELPGGGKAFGKLAASVLAPKAAPAPAPAPAKKSSELAEPKPAPKQKEEPAKEEPAKEAHEEEHPDEKEAPELDPALAKRKEQKRERHARYKIGTYEVAFVREVTSCPQQAAAVVEAAQENNNKKK